MPSTCKNDGVAICKAITGDRLHVELGAHHWQRVIEKTFNVYFHIDAAYFDEENINYDLWKNSATVPKFLIDLIYAQLHNVDLREQGLILGYAMRITGNQPKVCDLVYRILRDHEPSSTFLDSLRKLLETPEIKEGENKRNKLAEIGSYESGLWYWLIERQPKIGWNIYWENKEDIIQHVEEKQNWDEQIATETVNKLISKGLLMEDETGIRIDPAAYLSFQISNILITNGEGVNK